MCACVCLRVRVSDIFLSWIASVTVVPVESTDHHTLETTTCIHLASCRPPSIFRPGLSLSGVKLVFGAQRELHGDA